MLQLHHPSLPGAPSIASPDGDESSTLATQLSLRHNVVVRDYPDDHYDVVLRKIQLVDITTSFLRLNYLLKDYNYYQEKYLDKISIKLNQFYTVSCRLHACSTSDEHDSDLMLQAACLQYVR